MRTLWKDKWAWILFAGSIFLCWLFVGQYGIFGSRVDWVCQHSVLPDYFRQRFYETGDLFPDLAWNLGGGQNIYNFSYYGLFNPVILFSYILPFIRMDIYIMVSSILCYGTSVVLFYRWMDGRKFPASVRIGASCMFALAAPLIYHSYNQLMFVNYMPFLCLAFWGTDRYFRLKRKGMLLCGVCGMIFSSFYFSIGGLAALCIYALGEYLWETEKTKSAVVLHDGDRTGINRRKNLTIFLKKAGAYVGNLLLAVSLTGILLVPSFLSIFSGRQADVRTEAAVKLIAFKPERFFYSAYGIGLSTFGLVCLIGGVICYDRWRERWNSLCLLIIFLVPAFGYLLNGGLYDKDKVFIPFLPLVCLEIGKYSSRLLGQRKIKALFPYVITIFLVCVERNYGAFSKYWPLMLADICLMMILFLVYRKCPGLPWPLLASCIILFAYGWIMNPQQEKMLSTGEYAKIQDKELADAVEQIQNEDTSFYRMDVVGNGTENKNNLNRVFDIRQNITSIYSSAYNACYEQFRKDIFKINEPFRNHMMQSATDQPCFLQLMGVKYLAAKQAPDGYELLKTGKNFNIYKNESAAPIAYVTDQIMGENEYSGLTFPGNQTALLQNAVVPEEYGAIAAESDWKVRDIVTAPEDKRTAKDKRTVEEITKEKTADRESAGMTPCELTLPLMDTEKITIEKTDSGYLIEAKEETAIEAVLSETGEKDTLLALIFDVENQKPNKDMYIRVQGQTNRLSSENHEYANHNTEFSYMVTLQDVADKAVADKDVGDKAVQDQELPDQESVSGRSCQIKLGPGKYKISNLRAFSGSMKKLENTSLYENPVEISRKASKGDILTGNVTAETDGYLITSIPYDKNFTVKVDGTEVELLKVNTSFVGAKIPEGEHEIVITYKSPGKGPGMLLSIIGVLILLIF